VLWILALFCLRTAAKTRITKWLPESPLGGLLGGITGQPQSAKKSVFLAELVPESGFPPC
jgi:hypothetical protein